ncbi:MAG TPA: hypothetical protein VMB50_16140 [Myxococcales bacterium]|nr:hypothetical protein [Myxococcales bacterium]
MARKKTKKRPVKRRSTRAKGAGSRRVARRKPVRKARKVKARRKATPARKRIVAAAPSRPPALTALERREAERKRLLREERALERDSENRDEPSALADSPEFIPGATEDSLAEELGEGALESAVSGGQAAEDIRDEDVDEDEGGPFVPTSGRQEFARDTDESNPKDGEPAAFPTPGPRPR